MSSSSSQKTYLSVLIMVFAISLLSIQVNAKVKSAERSENPLNLQDGDLVFQRSASQLGPALEIALGSVVTHVGIVFVDNDSVFISEVHRSVRKTYFKKWMARGVESKFAVMRLKDADSLLTDDKLAAIREEIGKHEGMLNDTRFDWDDERFYCSELVRKAFERGAGIELGKFERLGDFKLDHELVQFWLDMYFPEGPDLDLKVVTPVSIYFDYKLETVYTTLPERGSTW